MHSAANPIETSVKPTQIWDMYALIEDTSVIVSPPDVCMRLEALTRSGTADVQAFCEVISLDPNLTAQILRLANSASVGFRGRIGTVSRAVMVLGTDETLALAYAAYAVAGFSRLRSSATDMNIFWQHATNVALIAKAIAKEQNVLHPERLFVAGLLHDLGSLLINYHHPGIANDLAARAGASEQNLAELELETFGFSHAEVGAALLEAWQLPEALISAVRDHHALPQARYHLETAILHVADTLAAQFGANYCIVPNDEAPIDPAVLACLDMHPEFDRCRYFDTVAPEFVKMVQALMV